MGFANSAPSWHFVDPGQADTSRIKHHRETRAVPQGRSSAFWYWIMWRWRDETRLSEDAYAVSSTQRPPVACICRLKVDKLESSEPYQDGSWVGLMGRERPPSWFASLNAQHDKPAETSQFRVVSKLSNALSKWPIILQNSLQILGDYHRLAPGMKGLIGWGHWSRPRRTISSFSRSPSMESCRDWLRKHGKRWNDWEERQCPNAWAEVRN